MAYRFIIVGGGSAGCVLANRLSARQSNNVLLLEAGRDTPPDDVPDDIASPYAGRAAMNSMYIWDGMRAQLAVSAAEGGPITARYEQARVMGGGSSINGQVATRGAPDDYDLWERLGADGWNWQTVLPHFKQLESDHDFQDEMHGDDGPIILRRMPREEWDGFTRAIISELDAQGFDLNIDINGGFEEGYSPTPLNTCNNRRISSAIGYLDRAVRSRPNLTIRANTTVRRILFDGTRAIGVEIEDGATHEAIEAEEVILSAGAILSPTLLMHSGIGPAEHLNELGIPILADVPGVGANLQEHAAIHVSAYLIPEARATTRNSRHNAIYLRYASQVAGTGRPDMLLNFACRSGWHAVGRRLGTIQGYILQPFGRGRVHLTSADGRTMPMIDLNLVGDQRDMERLKDAFRRSANLLRSEPVRKVALDPFATSYSDRVRKTGQVTLKNKVMTDALAIVLDMPDAVRRFAIDQLVNDAPPLDHLLADDDLLDEHIRRTVSGVWHPAGTCKMGSDEDAMAVTDGAGRVRSVQGLRVADNSLMPVIPRGNTNLPAMMIAERISALVLAGANAR